MIWNHLSTVAGHMSQVAPHLWLPERYYRPYYGHMAKKYFLPPAYVLDSSGLRHGVHPGHARVEYIASEPTSPSLAPRLAREGKRLCRYVPLPRSQSRQSKRPTFCFQTAAREALGRGGLGYLARRHSFGLWELDDLSMMMSPTASNTATSHWRFNRLASGFYCHARKETVSFDSVCSRYEKELLATNACNELSSKSILDMYDRFEYCIIREMMSIRWKKEC